MAPSNLFGLGSSFLNRISDLKHRKMGDQKVSSFSAFLKKYSLKSYLKLFTIHIYEISIHVCKTNCWQG